jgi:hypothetical protein
MSEAKSGAPTKNHADVPERLAAQVLDAVSPMAEGASVPPPG